MVYRNGWREFFNASVSFGLPMSLFFIIRYGVALGLAGGVLSGLLFGAVMTIIVRVTEKKFAKMRAEIAADRRVICDGGATWQGLGGWMFLTEAGLEFYPHKFNHGKQNFAIPTEEMVSVRVKRNIVTVALTNGSEVSAVVSHAKEWEKQIKAVILPSSDDYAL
jgi:hypothetical protein